MADENVCRKFDHQDLARRVYGRVYVLVDNYYSAQNKLV